MPAPALRALVPVNGERAHRLDHDQRQRRVDGGAVARRNPRQLPLQAARLGRSQPCAVLRQGPTPGATNKAAASESFLTSSSRKLLARVMTEPSKSFCQWKP